MYNLVVIAMVFSMVFGIVAMALDYKKKKLIITSQARAAISPSSAPYRRSDATFTGARGTGQMLATFRLTDGTEVELPVAESEALSFRLGEAGILEWQGNRYLRFETLR